MLSANDTAHHHFPPASDDLVLRRIDERVETAAGVGEHRKQRIECPKYRHDLQRYQDRVDSNAEKANGKAHRHQHHCLNDVRLCTLVCRFCSGGGVGRSLRLIVSNLLSLTANHAQDLPVSKDEDGQRHHVQQQESC